MSVPFLGNQYVVAQSLGPDSDKTLVTQNVLISKKYFVMWNAHMSTTTTRLARMNIQINGSIDSRFSGTHKSVTGIYGNSANYYGQGVFTTSIFGGTQINLLGREIGGASGAITNFGRIAAIELDQLVENTDYFYSENNVAKVNIDDTYSNNVGSELTFTPDGVSDYLVMAYGSVDNPTTNTKGSYGGMRLQDITATSTLSEMKRDVYSPSVEGEIEHTFSGMWILQAPAAIPKTLQTQFVGANIWDHRASNIFILRLNTFNHYMYDQSVAFNTWVDTASHLVASYPTPHAANIIMARMVTATTDVTHAWGLTSVGNAVTYVDQDHNNGFATNTDVPALNLIPDAITFGHVTNVVGGVGESVDMYWQQALALTNYTKEICTLSFNNILALEYDPPIVSNEDPIPNAINIGVEKMIKFRLSSNPTAGVDATSINVNIDDESMQSAIINGIFQPGYSGFGSALIPLSDGSGYDVQIKKEGPWTTNQTINLYVDASNETQGIAMSTYNYSFTTATYAFSYTFTTQTHQFVYPATYTEELILTTIPSGFSAQTTGTGASPTYSASGMTTIPNAAGSSFIKRSAAGLNFEDGVLFDVIVQVPSGSTAPQKRIKVLRLSKGDHGVASIYIDFTTKEMWLDDIVNIPQSDFRPGVKDAAAVFFRLSVKGVGENMVARLYSAKENSIYLPLLKQTGGPSILIPSVIDSIDIGSIESGDAEVLVKSVKILLGEDPDNYYPFPQVSKIAPKSDVMSGGENFKVEFDTEIDIDAGSLALYAYDNFNDESTGAGSINAKTGILSLILAGIGTAAVRILRSFSGDLPSGTDISTRIQVSQSILDKPPQSEVILAGVEIRSNGNTLAIELVTDIVSGSFFKIKATSGGSLILDKKVLATHNNDFILRFIKAENQIRALVNGIVLIDTSLKDGPGIIKYYAETTEDIGFITQISDITVRPVIMIGNSIVNV